MEIWVVQASVCGVSLYYCNGATRKARLKLSAIAMSSEQSRTRATGDAAWLGIERSAALFNLGTRHDFRFLRRHRCCNDTFVRKLGLSIAQNANLVEYLRIGVRNDSAQDGFFKRLLSLDVWKEALPSLQDAYLIVENFYDDTMEVSPHLMKHVRGQGFGDYFSITPAYLDFTSNMIRNKDNVIEEINFHPDLLCNAKLLDDTLMRVRSFEVEFADMTTFDFLARSLERTKAEGDNLECVSIVVSDSDYFDFTVGFAVETIVRSRPNLQVLNLQMLNLYASSSHDFVLLCNVVASSTLIAFICNWCDEDLTRVEGAVDVVGKLLQHSTIRDFRLTIGYFWHGQGRCHDNFVQGVAEGLRATPLRRFHLTMFPSDGPSIASMTKLYESVTENRNLVDIQLKGTYWDTWREWRYDLSHLHPPPCPFSFFEFLSKRNQYLFQLLMRYEHTLPAGLWPLILAFASCDASTLYYLLTVQPHLVKGKVEGTVAVDREWDVDGPARKCRRIA